MNKKLHFWILSIAAMLFLSAGLMAQEQVEVSIKVKKDGKVVKDTTYQFEDASKAKHAMRMMEVLSGDDQHMEHVSYNITSTHTQGGHSKAMVFISEDGEEFNITELHSDSLEWISEGDEPHGEHVIIRKSKDGNTYDVLIDGAVAITVASNTTNYTTLGLADGIHTWRVKAYDHAANSNTSVQWAFIVDTTLPGLPVLSGPANGSSTVDSTPTLVWNTCRG